MSATESTGAGPRGAAGAPGPAPGPAPASAPVEVTIVAHDIGAVGGMERVLGELITGLCEAGHRVTVIARKCVLPSLPGLQFHRVRGPGRPFLIAYPWFLVAGSLALRRRRRGVVQSTGAIVLGRTEIVSVHYLHQVGPVNPSRASFLYRWQVKAAGVLKRAGERLIYPRCGALAFVCVSDGVAAEMREHFPSLAARVMTIHNGVDTGGFAPGAHAADARALRERLQLPTAALVALFVGSEWHRKGLEPVLRALAQAPVWVLLVAGGGDEARYRALAAELGVGDRVRWLGVVTDVAPLYGLADAFVLPSSYETFSLVSFEAAASGLPVLAAPVSGVRELIEDGRNGFLIDREPETIARRLSQLRDDPELRRRLGAAARESALQYSWARMVARHRELYARVAAREAA